jgi:hypothetical protein
MLVTDWVHAVQLKAGAITGVKMPERRCRKGMEEAGGILCIA